MCQVNHEFKKNRKTEHRMEDRASHSANCNRSDSPWNWTLLHQSGRSDGSNFRPRAIEAGELTIDVAFIAASAADRFGNCTGQIGRNVCGALGYSFVDAHNAAKVVVITDTLVDFPCCPASISQQYVDVSLE